jgi:hypothetical protein
MSAEKLRSVLFYIFRPYFKIPPVMQIWSAEIKELESLKHYKRFIESGNLREC